jgi:hypothetical protein
LSQSDVNDSSINSAVEIDPDSIVVTLNGVELTEGSDYFVHDAGGPDDGVYVEGIPKGAVIQFEAIGGATFEAVTITNGAGDENPDDAGTFFTGADFAVGGFIYGQNDPGDPVEFQLPVKMTDGDDDSSTGTIDVTVNPVGSSSTLAATSTTLQTTSLTSANDNHLQRSFNTGTDAALVGAVAAAGLGTLSQLSHSIDPGTGSVAEDTQSVSSYSVAGSTDSVSHDQVVSKVALTEGSDEPAQSTDSQTSTHADFTAGNGDSTATDSNVQAPAELLQGTDGPAHGQAGAAAPLTAAAVAMPAAAHLLAAAAHNAGADAKNAGVTGDGGAQHNQVVAQVLADALHGGGHGPNLDALINALPGDHGAKGLEALASHGAAGVPNGDMTAFAGFTGGHAMPIMEQMAMHHDAAPAHS